MSYDLEEEFKKLDDDVDELVKTVEKIPAFVVEKVKQSEEKTIKNLKKLDEKISKVKTIQGQKGDKGDSIKGNDGYTPIKGLDYFDGKDGSPDTPTDIKVKLESLQGDDRLDASAIKGSENTLTNEHFNEILRAVSSINNVRTAMANESQRGIQSVTTDSTMTGNGTTGSPLSVVATSASDVAVTVRAATTAALAGTWTYNNGTSGVGATLTRTTNGALPNQDGVSLSDGDRILIKNQASTLVNGVYVLTQKGVTSVSPTIFTRATDADETSELDELVVTISEGSTNRGTVWGQQTNNPVVGTSAITFATVVSTAVTQATSGTQAINQIPLYTGTARQLTRGTANFKYNPTNDLFTIRGIDYTFPANNGDASQVLTTDGSGNLSWATGGGGSPAGSDTQIQYNNAGAFGADAGFTRTATGVTNISATFGGETISQQITDDLLGSGKNAIISKLITATESLLDFSFSDSGSISSQKILSLTGSTTKNEFSYNLISSEVTVGTNKTNLGLNSSSVKLTKTSDFGEIYEKEIGFTASGGTARFGSISGGNNTKITIDDVTQLITVSNVPTYADDAAATTGGLTTGQLYKTTTGGITALNIVP